MFNLTRQEQMVVIFLIGVIILGGGKLYYRNVIQERETPEIIEGERKEDIPESQIIVDIAGAVWRPGVYTLKSGARVKELVDKASPRGDANLEILNLAAPLRDGQKIVVPTKPEEVSPGKDSRGETSPSPPGQNQKRKINLNTATLSELNTLPGIGPIRAQAIINYRNQHNGFKNIEELKNTEGIGEITFQKVKELVTIY